MIRKGLTIGIVLLFIGSSVTSMVIGYNINPAEKSKQYNFNSYHISEVYTDEEQIQGNHVFDTVKSCESVSYKETTSPSNIKSPMNSSWPMYCHDARHTGQSPYNTLNTSIEKWRFGLPNWVYGSPVIDKNGTIYIGCLSDFYAINPNGTLKWKRYLSDSVESAPAIDKNGVIYFGGVALNYFYALYPNGTVKWKYYTGNQVTSSPAIGEDGTIYFGDWSAYINALYPNGTLRWRYHTLGAVLSSPAIGNDGMIYCGSHDDGLYALYPNNGTMKWRFGTGGWVRTAPCIADDGTIYCVSLDNYLYAVNPNGTMKWRTDVNAGTSPTIGPDGTIYAGWDRLYAVNPVNGSIKWVFNPGSHIQGGTPCHSADGTIYFGTDIGDGKGGEIIAVNPNGTEKWRKMIATLEVESAPAIAKDGTIYIGSSSDLMYAGSAGCLHAFGPGEQKNFEIISPKLGHFYLFGKDMGITQKGNTIVVGDITVQLQINSEDEIEGGVSFLLGTNFFYYNQYTASEPPYEWRMDKRYAETFFFNHHLTIITNYKGGCQWSVTILFWYIHLRKN